MASFPSSDDPSSFDPSMNFHPPGDAQQGGGGSHGPTQQGQPGAAADRRDPRADAPPPGHYPVHPSLFQPPPGYPAYGDPSRRLSGYGPGPDARDHLPPGLMPMYPGYPPAMHHGWPLDMYGRPQPMPPPDYRAGDPRTAMLRMPGSAGKGRDSMGMPGDESMEKESKKPQKKTEVACDFCRTRKLKCDGVHPQCGQCSQRDQSCHYQTGPPNRRGPGKKNRMGSIGSDSPGGPGPVSPRQRASNSSKKKSSGNMETMILDLGGPPPPPPGVMGVMGPPPGYPLPYPAPPPPGPPQ
ncbi:hypothetical protein CALCODRAFT_483322 [Calocera cornea HHB12733]|uniref:Zn(2)-C6 fungal-type domain-containing protein n=1 Tax=Calocera cornea HHB12733 TaxID=1353952 RepID=A0A165FVE7_9BASI|nr:hypothetical protein CALCODRAFT_483322 [Calocera cornea HHB12733]